jgi:hypothetical protein
MISVDWEFSGTGIRPQYLSVCDLNVLMHVIYASDELHFGYPFTYKTDQNVVFI